MADFVIARYETKLTIIIKKKDTLMRIDVTSTCIHQIFARAGIKMFKIGLK